MDISKKMLIFAPSNQKTTFMILTHKKSRRRKTLRSSNSEKGFTLVSSVDFVNICSSIDVLSSYFIVHTCLYQHDLGSEDVSTSELTRTIFSLPDSYSSEEFSKCYSKEFKRACALAYREHTHYQEIFNCFNS